MTLALSLGFHSNGVSSLVPGYTPSSYPACVFSPNHFQHDLFANLFTSLCLARQEAPGGQGLGLFCSGLYLSTSSSSWPAVGA